MTNRLRSPAFNLFRSYASNYFFCCGGSSRLDFGGQRAAFATTGFNEDASRSAALICAGAWAPVVAGLATSAPNGSSLVTPFGRPCTALWKFGHALEAASEVNCA